MDSPPPSDADWSQPATKSDIARLENRIGMTETRLDARCDVLEVRIGAVETTLTARIDAVKGELGGRIESFEGHVDHKISRLTWTMIVGYVATVLALVGLKAVSL